MCFCKVKKSFVKSGFSFTDLKICCFFYASCEIYASCVCFTHTPPLGNQLFASTGFSQSLTTKLNAITRQPLISLSQIWLKCDGASEGLIRSTDDHEQSRKSCVFVWIIAEEKSNWCDCLCDCVEADCFDVKVRAWNCMKCGTLWSGMRVFHRYTAVNFYQSSSSLSSLLLFPVQRLTF